MKKVFILVADLDMQVMVEELIPRFEKVFSFKPVEIVVRKHLAHDAGCFLTGHEIIRPLATQFDHALVMFDYEGSGQDARKSREEVAAEVQNKLDANGWNGRAKAVVIAPELENWVWTDSVKMFEIIGWKGEREQLLEALNENGWINDSAVFQKPSRPKEALEYALKAKKIKFLPKIHQKVGAEVSFNGCQDPAFLELVEFFRSISH